MKKSTENKQNCSPQGHRDTVKIKNLLFNCAFVSLWLIASLAFFQVSAVAGTEPKKELTVAEISKNVQAAQEAAKDSQMDLVMEMKDTLSGAVQKSKGKVQMKSPDKIFVHYTQPAEQFLYVGGNLSQMYQPDQKTVYQQRQGKGKNAAPVYLGIGKQLKKYIEISKVTLAKNSGDEVELLFIPNDKMDAGFDKMRVMIHKKDWWPYQIEMETPSMNTKAKFSNLSFNQGLKDSLFQFTPPEGRPSGGRIGLLMSLGSELKEARESRKITLAEVTKKTKIPEKYLEAIEENNFGVFPSQTYAKGFIRAYAKVVGIDPAVLTRQFNAENQKN